MIVAGYRTILDASFWRQELRSSNRMRILGSSYVTEEQRGLGDTTRNPNCK
jgi:hypothetical protein